MFEFIIISTEVFFLLQRLVINSEILIMKRTIKLAVMLLDRAQMAMFEWQLSSARFP